MSETLAMIRECLAAPTDAECRKRLTQVAQHLSRPGEFRFGNCVADLTAQRLFVDGVPSQLTPNETDLLAALIENVGKPVRREHLLSAIGRTSYGRGVDTHIWILRKMLGAHSGHIRTVHGSGYMLTLHPD